MAPRHILTKAYLDEAYSRQGKTCRQIASELGLRSSGSVKYALRKHSIPRRPSHAPVGQQTTRSTSKKWKGCGDLSGRYISSLRLAARRRDLVWAVTAEELWELYVSQDRKCSLSGVSITFAHITSNRTMKEQTASLDRIDSSRGYELDNLQWVHKVVQKLKWDWPEHQFLYWCKAIVSHVTEKEQLS